MEWRRGEMEWRVSSKIEFRAETKSLRQDGEQSHREEEQIRESTGQPAATFNLKQQPRILCLETF